MLIYPIFQPAKVLDYRAGFVDAKDYDSAYMQSLHLASEFSQFGYKNIVGVNDKPGDVRTESNIPWDDNASECQKEECGTNKSSYIDMPNLTQLLKPKSNLLGFESNG
ncbi:MAG: hypothetical protein IPG53_14750 [Ignavibacteriales bacterium]|nr:hypothetical protein [Ignavibacteriales bacterium]